MDFLNTLAAGLIAFLSAWLTARYQRQASQAEFERQRITQKEEQEFVYIEKENAQRVLVQQYAKSLLPLIKRICEIKWLDESTNKNEEDKKKLQKLKRFILTDALDCAHPQTNAGYQGTFLIYQFIAAFNLALAMRVKGYFTPTYKEFINNWERQFLTVFCSTIYPGIPWFFREQLEVIGQEMLIWDEKLNQVRPLNWFEFTHKLNNEPNFKSLCEALREKIVHIFREDCALANRLQTQTRFAFFALYLLSMLDESDMDVGFKGFEQVFWNNICCWYRDNPEKNGYIYVFQKGDVAKRCNEIKNGEGFNSTAWQCGR